MTKPEELAEVRVPFPAGLPSWAMAETESTARSIVAACTTAEPARSLAGIRRRIEESLLRDPAGVVGAFFLSVLCDLALQGWRLAADECEVVLEAPSSAGLAPEEEKERVRAGHLVERQHQLQQPTMRAFLRRMEESRLYNGKWVSVFSLMRDGEDLAGRLRQAIARAEPLTTVIDPYLQFIGENDSCEFTGLRLADVWRYFRATWSSAYKSVPGRRMHLLVRDRAAPFHPVIGIAALSSAVVQLSVRDRWIGWVPDQILGQLREHCTDADARHFIALLCEAIDDIYIDDFLEEGLVKRIELVRPTLKTISRLMGEAERARRAHEAFPNATNYKAAVDSLDDADWEEQARSFLFRSKRAATLAQLLQVRRTLMDLGMDRADGTSLAAVLARAEGRKALAALIRSAKARRVGIDILDVTTCGAIAPYSHLLGGKLVALLLLSPEVVAAHRKRYGASPSIIASAMKGRLVIREPQLVLLGTTSLYGVASSQYNRLRVPGTALPGSPAQGLEYKLLGRTVGFGSFHLSDATVELADLVLAQCRAGRRVNSIFGEGVSPRLRKLREALEIAGFPSDRLLKHGSPRLVYGAALATNFREVLLGRESQPHYIVDPSDLEGGTRALATYWHERWLRPRAAREDVLDAVARHTLSWPVRHGARVEVPIAIGTGPVDPDSLDLFEDV